MMDPALRIERRFDVSPDRLFDAWTNPGVAGAWLFTSDTSESHSTHLEVRVGGRWEIHDRREGVDYRALGEYLEVESPHRLVFTFGMPQFAPGFSKVTLEIAADGDGARMTLTQDDLPPEAHAATEAGWGAMFDLLARELGASTEERLVLD